MIAFVLLEQLLEFSDVFVPSLRRLLETLKEKLLDLGNSPSIYVILLLIRCLTHSRSATRLLSGVCKVGKTLLTGQIWLPGQLHPVSYFGKTLA